MYIDRLHPLARSKVYDMREHTPGTVWGPFLDRGAAGGASGDDGEGLLVDWEKVEAILVLLARKVRWRRFNRFPMIGNVWYVITSSCSSPPLMAVCSQPRTSETI